MQVPIQSAAQREHSSLIYGQEILLSTWEIIRFVGFDGIIKERGELD